MESHSKHGEETSMQTLQNTEGPGTGDGSEAMVSLKAWSRLNKVTFWAHITYLLGRGPVSFWLCYWSLLQYLWYGRIPTTLYGPLDIAALGDNKYISISSLKKQFTREQNGVFSGSKSLAFIQAWMAGFKWCKHQKQKLRRLRLSYIAALWKACIG